MKHTLIFLASMAAVTPVLSQEGTSPPEFPSGAANCVVIPAKNITRQPGVFEVASISERFAIWDGSVLRSDGDIYQICRLKFEHGNLVGALAAGIAGPTPSLVLLVPSAFYETAVNAATVWGRL